MSRPKKALAALAALAAASAAHPAAVPQAAPVNCSRHIRVGVFDDANHVDPRNHHRGAFFRTSVASLDA